MILHPKPQYLATGLLYASQHFQNFGILAVLTSESTKVSDFSPHITFAANEHGICDLTLGMIDKTLTAFNLCHHKDSLPSILA